MVSTSLVNWVRYEDSYRLSCVGGPEGIIVALADELKMSRTNQARA